MRRAIPPLPVLVLLLAACSEAPAPPPVPRSRAQGVPLSSRRVQHVAAISTMAIHSVGVAVRSQRALIAVHTSFLMASFGAAPRISSFSFSMWTFFHETPRFAANIGLALKDLAA